MSRNLGGHARTYEISPPEFQMHSGASLGKVLWVFRDLCATRRADVFSWLQIYVQLEASAQGRAVLDQAHTATKGKLDSEVRKQNKGPGQVCYGDASSDLYTPTGFYVLLPGKPLYHSSKKG